MKFTEEQLEAIVFKREAEASIQRHIDNTARQHGYDDMNSIAKYLTANNPFQAECETLSLWTGNVWATAAQVMSDVEGGIRPLPTLDELMAELPELVL